MEDNPVTIAEDCQHKLQNFLVFIADICKDDPSLQQLVAESAGKALDGWILFIERVANWLGPRYEKLFKILDGLEEGVERLTAAQGVELFGEIVKENGLGFVEISGIVTQIVRRADAIQLVRLMKYLYYFATTHKEINSKD